MGGRKVRLGRIPRYMERKRQAAKVNKKGFPKKFHEGKEKTASIAAAAILPPRPPINLKDVQEQVALPSPSWSVQSFSDGVNYGSRRLLLNPLPFHIPSAFYVICFSSWPPNRSQPLFRIVWHINRKNKCHFSYSFPEYITFFECVPRSS